MSQMGHHARVVTSSDLRRRSGQNFIKSFAIRTEPEKGFFAARAYRVKSSFGSDDGLRCVITTVLTPACAASLPTSSGVTCSTNILPTDKRQVALMRGLLAKFIIAKADQGEKDPKRLIETALLRLRMILQHGAGVGKAS